MSEVKAYAGFQLASLLGYQLSAAADADGDGRDDVIGTGFFSPTIHARGSSSSARVEPGICRRFR